MSQAISASEMAPGDSPNRVFLVSYPKIVFLYPTFVMSLIAGVYMALFRDLSQTGAFAMTAIFLLVLALNLIVFAFDFPRGTSLTLLFFIMAVVFGIFLLFRFTDILPVVKEVLSRFHPVANATFYFTFAAIMTFIYAAVFFKVRFDYWEVNSNELLHHHGFLSDLERFASTQMKVDKEITDIFEYLLLRSGRLILHPTNERRAIVLDNVFFINRKEAELTKLLGALRVKMEVDNV
jgi:hypothetical protein